MFRMSGPESRRSVLGVRCSVLGFPSPLLHAQHPRSSAGAETTGELRYGVVVKAIDPIRLFSGLEHLRA
jgi:glutathione peroxidase-family protein